MSKIIASEPFAQTPITDGARVTLHFSLLLADGHQVDSTRNGDPATFVMGDGNLLPGFEAVLLGLRGGDDRQFTLAPEAAFGAHREENVQWFARSRFRDEEIELDMIYSFANGDGELPGVIAAIEDDKVCVDFNHPLAGKPIIFDVSILQVMPPVAENAGD